MIAPLSPAPLSPSAEAQTIRPQLAASAAVFRRHEGRLELLLARRGRSPGAGLWSLPGGRVEAGETLAEAAAREVMEEVQVKADIGAIAGARDIILRDADGRLTAHFVVIAHAARYVSGTPTPGEEAAEVGWFAPDAVDGLPTTAGLFEIVAAAARIMAREM